MSTEQSTEVKAFLAEIAAVCAKHKLSISHEDCHGSFLIEPYDSRTNDWLLEATDQTQKEQDKAQFKEIQMSDDDRMSNRPYEGNEGYGIRSGDYGGTNDPRWHEACRKMDEELERRKKAPKKQNDDNAKEDNE